MKRQKSKALVILVMTILLMINPTKMAADSYEYWDCMRNALAEWNDCSRTAETRLWRDQGIAMIGCSATSAVTGAGGYWAYLACISMAGIQNHFVYSDRLDDCQTGYEREAEDCERLNGRQR